MFADLSLVVAFSAGVVSFFSPCFFPVIPAFFALMAGEGAAKNKMTRFAHVYVALAFILGFAGVFLLLGLVFSSSVSLFGTTFEITAARTTLAMLGGVLIILFGLTIMGVFPASWANRLRGSALGGQLVGRLSRALSRATSHTALRGVAAFFFGAGFAAAWSPCIGAVLGAVLSLTLAAPGQGLVLFSFYMLGFGLPLLLLGFFAAELSRYVEKFQTSTVQLQSIFGAALVVVGIFMILFPPQEVLKCF